MTDFDTNEDAINRVRLEFHFRKFKNIPENIACIRLQFPDLLLKKQFVDTFSPIYENAKTRRMHCYSLNTVFKDHENLKLFISRS